MAALFGAALVGFLLGVLLMILVISGRRDEDLVERAERSEAKRRLSDWEAETADPVKPGVEGLRSAQVPPPARAKGTGRPGRVDV